MKSLLILALLAAGCGAAFGQAPAPQQAPGKSLGPPANERMANNDAAFPLHVTGTIVAVDNNRRLMMIERADKTRLTFAVDPKVRAKADKDTALAGRKDLSLSDYKKGQLVSVTYRDADRTALEIRLKHPKTD